MEFKVGQKVRVISKGIHPYVPQGTVANISGIVRKHDGSLAGYDIPGLLDGEYFHWFFTPDELEAVDE